MKISDIPDDRRLTCQQWEIVETFLSMENTFHYSFLIVKVEFVLVDENEFIVIRHDGSYEKFSRIDICE